MDWIRRNWPDLIIGLALLLVIAGIIATLLSGGSFLSLGNGPTDASPPPAVNDDSTFSAQTDLPAVADSAEDAAESPQVETAPADSEAGAAGEEAGDAVSASQADITPVVPGSSGESGTTSSTVDDAVASAVADSAVSTSEEVTDAPYRISVGSYRDAANAERRAQSFRDAGYPTFIAAQDDLSIVLVGPYDAREAAEAALADIQREGLEAAPLLFDLSSGSETATVVDTGASAEVAAADTSSSAAGANYLQAGAYNTSESAQPQRARLEALGLSVSEVTEGSFVKLLVGPLTGGDLSAAQARLDAEGIDYFVRGN